jgi:GH24 family phage-related lysozyme (muramidase)
VTLRVTEEGAQYTAGWEGFKSYWYDDATELPWGTGPGQSNRGTPTIGFGETDFDGKTITRDEAASLLRRRLNGDRYGGAVRRAVAIVKWDDIPQVAFERMVDFTYNLGPGWVPYRGVPASGFETLGRAWLKKDPAAIAAALMLYNKSGSVVMLGLTRRRQSEGRDIVEAFREQDPILTDTEARWVNETKRIRIRVAADEQGWDNPKFDYFKRRITSLKKAMLERADELDRLVKQSGDNKILDRRERSRILRTTATGKSK